MLNITHSTNAHNILHNLNQHNDQLAKSVARISSGNIITKASDDPTKLALSERMKTDIASLRQAQENTTLAVSVLQTSEGSIEEITNLLNNLKQTVLHASNEAVLDDFSKQADQIEIDHVLKTIERIVDTTRFSDKQLLTGENSTTASVVGGGLSILETGNETITTDSRGLDIDLFQMPTKTAIKGRRVLTGIEKTTGGIEFKIIKDNKNIAYTTKPEEDEKMIMARLQEKINEAGMDLTVSLDQKRFLITSNQYGTGQEFIASTSVDNLLTKKAFTFEESSQAKDVAAMIGDHFMQGKGEMLIAKEASPLNGLVLKIDTDIVKERDDFNTFQNNNKVDFNEEFEEEFPELKKRAPQVVGIVKIHNDAMIFQNGANQGDLSAISMKSLYPKDLAVNILNESGFENLSDISIDSYHESQDSLKLIERAIKEVVSFRGELGSLQKNEFETQMAHLDSQVNQLTQSNSLITDTDIASEIVEMTKHKIQNEANLNLLQSVNQDQETALNLLF